MSTSKIFVYNPAEKSKEQLVAEFVIRQDVFEKIMKELKSAGKTTPPQHFLVAGQRGMGKTTLLLRIKYGIEDDTTLSKFLIPIRFSEEQYHIASLERLWEETARLLEDKDPAYANLYDEMLTHENEKDYESISFGLLEKKLKASKQRALLMIDNIGDLFDKFSDIQHHRLRKILMTSSQIQVMGGSAKVLEHTFSYEKPFFEFFHEIKLQPLDEKATHALLRALAKGYGGTDRIEDLIQNNPGRIDALRKLTGGVPRTMVLLFEIFIDEVDGNAFEDLQLLLDNVNSLYKHRMEELKPQQQQIVDALARAYTPITASEVLQQSKLYRSAMQTNQISSQLKQLTDNQLVEATEPKGRTKAYSIRERFFNIWYLMRHGRKQNKEEVRWLIHFFEVWYNAKEWNDLAKRQIDCMRSQRKYSVKAAYYKAQALHSLPLDEKTKAELMEETQKFLLSTDNRELADVIKKYAVTADSGSFIKRALTANSENNKELALQYFLEAVKNKETDAEIFLASFYEEALGDTQEAEKWYLAAPKPSSPLAKFALAYWHHRKGEYEIAVSYYLEAAAEGDADSINNLGVISGDIKKDYDKAEAYYLKAVDIGDVNAMYNLANLYNQIKNDYDKAEEYYLKAVDKGDVNAAYNLANLYNNIRKDYNKSEEFYLKAIDKGHVGAMNNLAQLYQNVRMDNNKAEEYFLKASEKGGVNAMNNLGLLYLNVKKDNDKAIEFFLKAADKGDIVAMFNLAVLYQSVKKDYQKAELYYLKALEGGDKDAYYLLGLLYYNDLNNYDKAKYYFLNAVDAGNNDALLMLGDLYEEIRKDYDKAERYYLEAFKKGIKKKAIWNLVILHETANKNLKETVNYCNEVLADNPNDLYTSLLLAMFALTNSNYNEAFKHAATFLNLKEAYGDLASVIALLRYLMENKQYHFLLNQFKQENGLLMLHAKPYYYALAWFMRDDLPGEYEKTPAELKETVQEIIKTA